MAGPWPLGPLVDPTGLGRIDQSGGGGTLAAVAAWAFEDTCRWSFFKQKKSAARAVRSYQRHPK